jgi:hypothetical protein
VVSGGLCGGGAELGEYVGQVPLDGAGLMNKTPALKSETDASGRRLDNPGIYTLNAPVLLSRIAQANTTKASIAFTETESCVEH